MRKLFLWLLIIIVLTGCSKNVQITKTENIILTQEQQNYYENQIESLLKEKSWNLDNNINFSITNIPLGVEGTYYEDIIKKSKDCGLELSNHLGNDAIEGMVNLKYLTGDVGGEGHFLFAQDKIVGAYYLVGNYIYSLNEKEVFKKQVEWKNIENTKVVWNFEGAEIKLDENLIGWGKYSKDKSYIFSYVNNKIKIFSQKEDEFFLEKEIFIDGLYLIDMFFKDVDRDGKSELGLLLTNSQKITKDTLSKLIVYDIENELHKKLSKDFKKPMLSVDYDGKSFVATSQNSIEMYDLVKNKLVKNYLYSKIGGTIKVDDIDGSGIPRYILIDDSGKDIYMFEKSKNGLEEVWRSYNEIPQYKSYIQTGDLNNDGVKEIYVQDNSENMKKIILQENGFIEVNDIPKGHKYFIGDFNNDGNFEYFDILDNVKSVIYSY